METTCPNCGYCRHCGRGAIARPYLSPYVAPYYPGHYGGWWQVQPYQPIAGGITYTVAGTVPYTMAGGIK